MRIGTHDEATVNTLIDTLQSIGRTHGCLVQAIDARYVISHEHISHAVCLARRAETRETLIADDLSMEVLLYIAATRQIERALEIGVGEETEAVVVVVDGESEAAAIADVESHLCSMQSEIPSDHEAIRQWFNVGEVELQATDASLGDLVCERVTLLQLEA